MTEAQAGKVRFRRRPIGGIASLLSQKEKSAAKICLAGNEKHSEAFLRSGRLLVRGLHDAQRHRLQHAHGETQRGTEDRRRSAKPKVERQDRHGPHQTGVVRLEAKTHGRGKRLGLHEETRRPGVSALCRAVDDHQSARGRRISARAQHLSAQRGRGQTQRRAGGLGRRRTRSLPNFSQSASAPKRPIPTPPSCSVDFMLSEEGQKIIASFGRVPTRRGVSTNVQGLDKLNYVIDDIGAGDDFNKNYELFRSIFGAPKQ